MTAAEHLAALSRLYGPGTPELRDDIRDGLKRALVMLDAARAPGDIDALNHQLVGLQRIASRLRERFKEVA